MTEVLVIIDMQIVYPAAQDRTLIDRIETAAEWVVNDGGKVVAINFDGSGMSTVKLPPNTHTIWKRQNDGGTELYSYLLGADLINKDLRVRVCGVNLSACVFETASGVGHRLYEENALFANVEIITNLCGDGA